MLRPPARQSFFLFGPRGVGKTAWVRERFADALIFDLLESETYTRLLAAPSRLADQIPAAYKGWVMLDEIQRVPDLLNEVHRLIETRRLRFAMTGSSARKLRRRGVNLLAGRALTRFMHPLTAGELGRDFDLQRALRYGCLPFACTEGDPRDYLASYVTTYLREEVQQEGLAPTSPPSPGSWKRRASLRGRSSIWLPSPGRARSTPRSWRTTSASSRIS